MDDLIDPPGWHVYCLGQLILAHPKRAEELLQEDLARVHRCHDRVSCHGPSQ